jgi:acyl-coenzyme A synthetase/AMP-(fatty) acid ligase
VTVLLGSGLPDTPLIWCAGQPVSRRQFASAVHAFAAAQPMGSNILNLCAGRLRFMVVLAAAGLRGQVTVLPQSSSASALAAAGANNSHCINDAAVPFATGAATIDQPGLQVPESATACILYTSGTTGSPQPHHKTWAALATTAALDAERLLESGPVNIVATVPPQHMYGLQTTMLLPLFADCAVHDGRPFFPADVSAALAEVPAPRMLVTTPLHLRTCVESRLPMPPIAQVLCATAPLSLELAQRAETEWRTAVMEIYGSTEAGTIGTRRTVAGDRWRLLPKARLDGEIAHCTYHAAHLPASILLRDCIERLPADGFRLLGRDADQIKVAGKRGSLAELNAQLLRVPGVVDGVIFVPDGCERTAALVVAPALTANSVRQLLAQTIDEAFLPRQLVLLSQLPRDTLGKLARKALSAALRS